MLNHVHKKQAYFWIFVGFVIFMDFANRRHENRKQAKGKNMFLLYLNFFVFVFVFGSGRYW